MRDLGFKLTELRHIHFDMTDIRERQKRPDVLELAKSRARIALHPITVHAATKELVAGRDRLAADLLNKVTRAPVRWLDGTEAEMQEVELEENLRRRNDNRDELIAKMVEITTAKIPDTSPSNSPRQPGRPKSPVGEAREQVAKKLSTTPEAVRSAVTRARPEKEPTQDDDHDALPPPIALKGRSPTAAWLDEVRQVQRFVDNADKAGRALQAALGALTKMNFPQATLQRFEQAAHQLTSDVRALRPRSVCLVNAAGCKLCSDTGWLGADADAIQDSVAPVVVPVAKGSKAAEGVGPRKPAPAAKKLTITDAEGAPLAVDEDDEAF